MNRHWLQTGMSPFAVAFRARSRRLSSPGVLVEHYTLGRWSVIDVAGEMDLRVAPLMPVLLGGEAAHVVFDLQRVTFMDGAGLAVIAQHSRRATAAGGSVRIVSPSGQVRRLLAITGADRSVPIYDSLERAASGSAPVSLERGW